MFLFLNLLKNNYITIITLKTRKEYKKMTREEIEKNQVNSINQFKVLQYLKKHLDIYCFKIILYDKNRIKVIDRENKVAYFKYDTNTKEVIFIEEN